MRTFTPAIAALFIFWAVTTQAALTIPGADGSDGSLHVTEDTVIDLSQAAAAVWDTPSSSSGTNGSNAGNGVYDSEQWAVVFKYSSVTVEAGATLTFTNHPSRAPVVLLVSGDVTIDGSVNLNGKNWSSPPNLAEPGPGGFRGGTGCYSYGACSSPGFGVGGGNTASNVGYGGSYGGTGSGGPATYGNPSLIPLIGGSGGGGDQDGQLSGGGGGGGGILIACEGTLTINGNIIANGGSGRNSHPTHTGGGAGGGVRLVADNLAGNGMLSAVGGGGYNSGGLGRIRVEYINDQSSLQITPSPSVVQLDDSSTALIWPPADGPRVRILSIGGEMVSEDPRASFGTYPADAVIAETDNTLVLVETTNVEAESTVEVRVTPRTNTTFRAVDAAVDTVVSENPLIIHWTAEIPVQVGHAAVQVKVVRP